jgi:hypothetical protein
MAETVQKYRHKYEDDAGKPLANCPTCGHTLTLPDTVTIFLNVCGVGVETTTRLEDGVLVDTPEKVIAAGYHAGSECAACGEPFDDHETLS